ncbi:hypothetical protein MTR67_051474 [Solanum verrucosum]|uniref:Uncharacterized protein n=1 Tax=Solanum verrucosum TaxID=315347 RepID=A0AAF0V6A1_SOLVR|nr:hypothetical protein MTR67_051474 [Solanum verrucosum]
MNLPESLGQSSMRIQKTLWFTFKRCLRSCMLVMLSVLTWIHTSSRVFHDMARPFGKRLEEKENHR